MRLQRSASTIPTLRLASHGAFACIVLAALAACGGGGSSTSGPPSTVSSLDISAPKYGATALVTVNGSGLDSSGFSVTSPGCKNMTRLTVAPTQSTATTAYYNCVVSGAYTSSVVASSNGSQLASKSFSVAVPKVTMTLNNGVSGTGAVTGSLVLTLRGDVAPITVDNFLSYVNSGFYNGLIFHRYSPGFVVQGGGYGPSTNNLLPSPKAASAPINYEAGGGSNLQWTVAMARTQALNSASSQFFINLADNSLLDAAPYGPYAVFASVDASSIPLVQSMTTAPCVLDPTDLPAGDCLPAPNIVITSATQTQ